MFWVLTVDRKHSVHLLQRRRPRVTKKRHRRRSHHHHLVGESAGRGLLLLLSRPFGISSQALPKRQRGTSRPPFLSELWMGTTGRRRIFGGGSKQTKKNCYSPPPPPPPGGRNKNKGAALLSLPPPPNDVGFDFEKKNRTTSFANAFPTVRILGINPKMIVVQIRVCRRRRR